MMGTVLPFKTACPGLTGVPPRDRVMAALSHREPDRCPVDFLATPEIWEAFIKRYVSDSSSVGASEFFDPDREALLRLFEVDCRVVSYDMFCQPPDAVLRSGAHIDWWHAQSRSTPNRMWRQITAEGEVYDIWGHHIRIAHNPTGAYEEFASWPLSQADSVSNLTSFRWPEPDWWDFSGVPAVIDHLNQVGPYHIRFRIGSVFEIAWQLRGMQQLLIDLATEPDIPMYIMDRLTEIHVENLKRVLHVAGDKIDMVYLYDDVATQNSLMVSKAMWRKYVRPCHARIIEIAKAHGKAVMYHCDGAIYPLIPELIDLGIDVLNPIQVDAKGMDPAKLKAEFGGRLAFHGGVDIVHLLPRGTPEDVAAAVRSLVRVLGENGGYILSSAHHIQSDTPLDNVLALYEPALRLRVKE